MTMPAPLGYFLTWTTYGTWLPGDNRGWVDKHTAAWHVPIQEPDPNREARARERLKEPPALLNHDRRRTVELVIIEECEFRQWALRAVSAQSNHVHVVVSVGDVRPGKVMGMLKKRCTDVLGIIDGNEKRIDWWTEDGSKRYLNSEASLRAAIEYVNNQRISWMAH